MSAQAPAAIQTGPDDAARRRSAASLYVALGLLLVVLILVMSGFLVRLDNDHNEHSVLPGAVPAGGVASGDLTLADSGWLPIEVTLQPKLSNGTPTSFPTTLTVSILRLSDGATLYSGPLRSSIGPLLALQPGEAQKLHLEVRNSGSAGVPLGYTYYWNARPAVPWWWWIPLILLVALVAAGGYWRPGRSRVAT
ncbi:MAG: hypothetical protein M3Z98_01515 [Candidatus Dormibacteraeota bacterium]|nr:hypothetical protein [Candidatus Dormibacteraeota bacterium]